MSRRKWVADCLALGLHLMLHYLNISPLVMPNENSTAFNLLRTTGKISHFRNAEKEIDTIDEPLRWKLIDFGDDFGEFPIGIDPF